MNNLRKLVMALLFLAALPMSAQNAAPKWAALQSFHEVFTRAYPPGQTNLEGVRAYSQTMTDMAKELSRKDVPREIKTEALMKNVTRLQIKVNEVNKLVKSNGSDEALKKAMTETQQIYHEIVAMSTGDKR